MSKYHDLPCIKQRKKQIISNIFRVFLEATQVCLNLLRSLRIAKRSGKANILLPSKDSCSSI